ncbi:MAG: sugar phosphate nucleotidyltransferase [Candidatus Bathyarchaeota archaeon]|nr:sugar phosphate nucleotidyltransferase [Candidatus Bathyarchaeota archaeon]
MIRKAIIPAAGLGTRLLPATKEQPKEMLPVLTRSLAGDLQLKPFLQLVFEQIYEADIREICFIVGRGKRIIEDHFTLDEGFLDYLKSKNKTNQFDVLNQFYKKINECTIVFRNQPKPAGLADAVNYGQFFSGSDEFLVHAGDDLILSDGNYIRKLSKTFTEQKCDAIFYVERVKDPSKYGVVIGNELGNGVFNVTKVVEKPSKPVSNLAIIAIYIFNSKVYRAIQDLKPGFNNEKQLTDAIQMLLDQGEEVLALEVGEKESRIDIGDPGSYKKAFLTEIKQRD